MSSDEDWAPPLWRAPPDIPTALASLYRSAGAHRKEDYALGIRATFAYRTAICGTRDKEINHPLPLLAGLSGELHDSQDKTDVSRRSRRSSARYRCKWRGVGFGVRLHVSLEWPSGRLLGLFLDGHRSRYGARWHPVAAVTSSGVILRCCCCCCCCRCRCRCCYRVLPVCFLTPSCVLPVSRPAAPTCSLLLGSRCLVPPPFVARCSPKSLLWLRQPSPRSCLGGHARAVPAGGGMSSR